MTVIFDNRGLYESAEKIYHQLNCFYDLWKKADAEKNSQFKSPAARLLHMTVKEACQLPPPVRNHFSGFNETLDEILSKGIVRLPEWLISPGDPAARKIYFETVLKRLFDDYIVSDKND